MTPGCDGCAEAQVVIAELRLLHHDLGNALQVMQAGIELGDLALVRQGFEIALKAQRRGTA